MLTYKDFSVWVDGNRVTDYISFIWTDRYNECGDFEMEVPYSAENENFYKVDQTLTCSLSDKKMIIETIKISISEENGKRMLLTGRSWESVLDRRVVAMTQVYDNEFFDKDKFMNAFKEIFKVTFGKNNQSQSLTQDQPNPNRKDYKESKIWSLRRGTDITVGKGNDPNGHIKNAKINIESTNKTVLEVLQEHCQAKDFGFEMIDNTCRIYDGSEKNVEFSMEKGNLISADYQASKQNYKNVAYVQGEEYTATHDKYEVDGVVIDVGQLEDNQALILTPSEANEEAVYYRTEVDLAGASGLNRREISFDSSKALGQNANRKYVARLQAEGRVELLKNHRWEVQASCEVMHDPYLEYRKDYYLGDIVNVSLDTIYNVLDKSGNKHAVKNIKMRVNEFTISHSEAGLDIYPTLVAYDADKYQTSNDSDAGYDPTEELDPGNEWMNDFVRVNFHFNGGHLQGATGVLYRPESGQKKKKIKYIMNAENPVWYIIPEEMNSGVIDTSLITGKFSYQQKGNFITLVDAEPVKEHYIFQGWYIGSIKLEEHVPGDDETGYQITKGDTEIDVYAKWEIERFDITFNHGEGGIFLTTGADSSGNIVKNFPYGAYPSPPMVCAEYGYHAASPLWSPELVAVEGTATYTAQWEKDDESDEDLDPEDSDYKNDDLPSDGTSSRSRDRRSTEKETPESSGESEPYYNLVHFRAYNSRVDDGYGEPNESTGKMRRLEDGEGQGGEFYFERDLDDGLKMTAHWYDPHDCASHGANPPGNMAGARKTNVGIVLWKDEHPLALWRWTRVGGFWFTPEVAFTTVPEYEPYYEKKTLQWGYEHGEIQMGLLHLAPVFHPFKYYRKIRINNQDTYWLLCVPPLNWLTNWGDYYYEHMAGYDVGFCCQYYDDAGEPLSPTWVRADGANDLKVNVDGKDYICPVELTYNQYNNRTGPNTIYPPNSNRVPSGTASSNVARSFNAMWIDSGWQYKRIPNERFDADGSELYTPDSISAALNYSGNLLINEQANIQESEGYDGLWGEGQYWYNTFGQIFGPGFWGYESYHSYQYSGYGSYSNHYYWAVENRLPDEEDNKGIEGTPFVGDEDEDILHKMSGEEGMGVRVVEQINNVISKSKALSYFTYQVFLPLVAKLKTRKWYVSSDGQNWHVITGAEGNSLEIETTNKTVAQNQAAGLTGADAIVGTNNSYYKSEVYYEDMKGRQFVKTSNVGQLRIDDTDISGADIEMDDLMNPDGTTKGIDISTELDLSKITDEMSFDDINFDQMTDITNRFESGSTAKQIAESTGIPESLINMVINGLNN